MKDGMIKIKGENLKMIKYFDIHNLVKIKIQTKIDSKVDSTLKVFREFEESFVDDKDVDIFIYDYSKCPNFKNAIAISNYYYYSNNYLNIPSKRFCFNFIDTPLIVYCDNFMLPLSLLVELILLNKGHSLVHSAAVQYNGKNYIFPAFVGVGKTTIVSGIVYSGGKLFGDDMNIVNEKEILSYPLDISIYPHHLDILKITDKKIKYEFMKTKMLNNITHALKRYDYRVIKLLILIINLYKEDYIYVPPKKIFSMNCIIEKGQINKIYYLYRVENNLSEITVERINPDNLAEICTNILFTEWPNMLPILWTYSALSTFSFHSLFSKIENIFRQIFIQHECYQIKIPNNLDNGAYQKQLISYLKK